MKQILILSLIIFAAGCNSAKNTLAGSGTSLQGTWTIAGSLGSGGSGTYQVELVSSPCSVTTPVGTFSVQGSVCFIANNNSGQGSISGTGLLSTSSNAGEGVLIGVAANPVPVNGTFNALFVLGDKSGNVAEFSGGGTVIRGSLTGTGSCTSSTPLCQGVTATFSGTQQ